MTQARWDDYRKSKDCKEVFTNGKGLKLFSWTPQPLYICLTYIVYFGSTSRQ